ncbi:MAG: hypothetical protein JRH08_03760 [Deltaproteobacteria bacterium]|nr:hypothetical protein [Deltaproteobacteria bacterium]MBW1927551.1 hypothetical protein [Deltaproteobacteria bacterium]MBW2026523.1 hypothetical protein [Deltaproteobacteria bacterium]MBW2124814.1 hypothetical protein [Deltaproteobacteria bacterium]RLB13151.1 MAG: hypothetical protein DRG63_10780 [Deltaproteobacteria bacterium]
MTKTFLTLREVKEHFEIEDDFLDLLESEEIICPECGQEVEEKRFPFSEIEKLRLAKILMDEMGVNLAGVEVILRLRQNMLEMRRQFDAILEDIAKVFKEAMDTMKKNSWQ